MTTIRPITMKEGVFPAFCGRIPPLLLAAMFAYSPGEKKNYRNFGETKIDLELILSGPIHTKREWHAISHTTYCLPQDTEPNLSETLAMPFTTYYFV